MSTLCWITLYIVNKTKKQSKQQQIMSKFNVCPQKTEFVCKLIDYSRHAQFGKVKFLKINNGVGITFHQSFLIKRTYFSKNCHEEGPILPENCNIFKQSIQCWITTIVRCVGILS